MESPGSDNVSDIIFDLRYLLFFFVFFAGIFEKGLNDQKLTTDLLQSALFVRM